MLLLMKRLSYLLKLYYNYPWLKHLQQYHLKLYFEHLLKFDYQLHILQQYYYLLLYSVFGLMIYRPLPHYAVQRAKDFAGL